MDDNYAGRPAGSAAWVRPEGEAERILFDRIEELEQRYLAECVAATALRAERDRLAAENAALREACVEVDEEGDQFCLVCTRWLTGVANPGHEQGCALLANPEPRAAALLARQDAYEAMFEHFVEVWHTGGEETGDSLSAFLGLTSEQYAAIVERDLAGLEAGR